MNKIIIMLLSIIVVIAAMVTALIIYMPEKEESVKIANIAQNKVDNDKNEMENVINVVETNTNEERISPNAFITFKQTYNECGHTKVEFVEVPQEFMMQQLTDMVSFIAPVKVYPGEDEIAALAGTALAVMEGREEVRKY